MLSGFTICDNSGCGARRNYSPVVQAERGEVQPLERSVQSQHKTSVIPAGIALRLSTQSASWRSEDTDGLGPVPVIWVADCDLGQLAT